MRSFGFLCIAVAALAILSCGGPQPGAARLAQVEALAKPSLPPWIASISPAGTSETLAQIRVIFAKPIAPVEALSNAGTAEVLRHVAIAPALRGHFALLTPRMIGFVADQALPVGTRVRITLQAGLRDVAGDTLDDDLAWTFETSPLTFTNLPTTKASDGGTMPPPTGLRPKLQVTANAAVDESSLAQHARLVGPNREPISVDAVLETPPTPYPGAGAEELFDPSLNTWIYDLRPTADLARGTDYSLEIDPGVEPRYGNLSTTQRFEGSLSTYAALEILPTPIASPASESRFASAAIP